MSSCAALAPRFSTVNIESQILGTLTVAEEEIFSFPTGLFGFPDCHSFVLVGAEREGFYWLQSVEHGTLAFVLVDPFLYYDGYSVDIGTADLAELGAADGSDLAILAIVTLPRSPTESPTANLQGPLALSFGARRGRQIALQDTEYGVRCPLDLAAASGA